MHLPQRFAVACIAASIAVAPCEVRAGDDAAALIAANTRFMGWTLADHSVRTLRLRGTAGKRNEAWQRVSRGALFREDIHDTETDGTAESGFSGNVFWRTDVDGFPLRLENRARERAIAEAFVLENAVAQLSGTVRSDDGTRAVVRVTPPEGAPIDLTLERATGKLTSATIDPDRHPLTFVVDRYADIGGGRKAIAAYHVGDFAVVATDVRAGVPVTDDDLAPSPSRATWSFGSHPSVPIDRTQRGVVFAAAINGVRGLFLLDTGASTTFVTDGFARKAHLRVVGTMRADTATLPLNGHYAAADSIAVGDSVLHDAIVATGIPALGGLDGVIGSEAAATAIVYVENGAKRVGFYDPSTFTPPAGKWTPIVVDLSRSVPYVPVSFVGQRDAYLMLDTGNSADTVVGYDLHDVIGDSVEFLRNIVGAGSLAGADLRCGWSNGINVGLLHWQRPVVCFGQSPGDDGILGYGMLEQFDWILDYPEARIFVLAHK